MGVQKDNEEGALVEISPIEDFGPDSTTDDLEQLNEYQHRKMDDDYVSEVEAEDIVCEIADFE